MPSTPILPRPAWLLAVEDAHLVNGVQVITRVRNEPLIAQNVVAVIVEARLVDEQGATLLLEGAPVEMTARHSMPIAEINRVSLSVIHAEMLAMVLGDPPPPEAVAAQFVMPDGYREGSAITNKIAIWNLMQPPPNPETPP